MKKKMIWLPLIIGFMGVLTLISCNEKPSENKKEENVKMEEQKFLDSFMVANHIKKYKKANSKYPTYMLQKQADTAILIFEVECFDILETDTGTIAVFVPSSSSICADCVIVCRIRSVDIIFSYWNQYSRLLVAVDVKKVASSSLKAITIEYTEDGAYEEEDIRLKRTFFGELLAATPL